MHWSRYDLHFRDKDGQSTGWVSMQINLSVQFSVLPDLSVFCLWLIWKIPLAHGISLLYIPMDNHCHHQLLQHYIWCGNDKCKVQIRLWNHWRQVMECLLGLFGKNHHEVWLNKLFQATWRDMLHTRWPILVWISEKNSLLILILISFMYDITSIPLLVSTKDIQMLALINNYHVNKKINK